MKPVNFCRFNQLQPSWNLFPERRKRPHSSDASCCCQGWLL